MSADGTHNHRETPGAKVIELFPKPTKLIGHHNSDKEGLDNSRNAATTAAPISQQQVAVREAAANTFGKGYLVNHVGGNEIGGYQVFQRADGTQVEMALTHRAIARIEEERRLAITMASRYRVPTDIGEHDEDPELATLARADQAANEEERRTGTNG